MKLFGIAAQALAYSAWIGIFGVAQAGEFQPGELIVKYRSDAARTRESMTQFYDSVGVKSVKRLSNLLPNTEQWVLKDGASTGDALAQLKSNPMVEYAQPNYILHTLPVETLSARADSAALTRQPCWIPGIDMPAGCGRPDVQAAPADVNPPVADPDLDQEYGLSKVGAIQAWRHFRGSRSFIVADVDTGFDYNHVDLSFNVWRNPHPDATAQDIVGYDFIHNDGLPYDDNDHGTHTAGTIGAVGGNGIGVSGVSQRVSIMAVKFLDGAGSGTTSNAILAIDYAVSHGARILNNSWGGGADQDNQALSDAIAAAAKKDVLFVAAAGNSDVDTDTNPTFPATFPLDNIISVAATDANDNLASYSNYGATTVHVAAPGDKVYSTAPYNEYMTLSGTSMACPHVTGAAALIWAKYPKLHYAQIKKALLETVDPIESLKGKVITGGRINVAKAMAALGKN